MSERRGTSEMDGRLLGFDQSPEMMVVVEGPDLLAVACNDAASAAIGGREIVGHSVRELAASVAGPQLLDLYAATCRTGEPSSGHGWRVEVEQTDGTTEAHVVDFSLTPWRGDDGGVRGVICSATDVTGVTHVAGVTDVTGFTGFTDDVHSHDAVAGDDAGAPTVKVLQDALLPAELPVVPYLDLGAGYLLCSDDERAGGDWFDTVVRPNGRLALVTGDVSGGGVAAAAVMGQLRAVLNEQLLGSASLGAAVDALDRYAGIRAESYAATVCVVEIDPASGRLEYCTAGHPPPLVVSASGDTRYLLPPGGGPLGTGTGTVVAEDGLAPADLLLLYTDGAILRPGCTVPFSTVELARIATDGALGRLPLSGRFRRPVERVCHLGLAELVGSGGHSDDIAMLAAHRVPPVLPFAARVPATASAVSRVRAAMADWLAPLELRPVDDMAVLHTLDELMTNAVTHAYADEARGMVDVDARLDATGELVSNVRDHGRWRTPSRRGSGGRGLAMVRGLADHLELHTDDHGTTATFRHRLGRPVQLLSPTDGGGTPVQPRPTAYRSRVSDDRMVVRGALDTDAADQLRVDLQLATRGRSLPLVVDLGDVTHLGSAAVQVLHEAAAGTGAELALEAPAGSVAQHVLNLVRLPHRSNGG